MKKNNKVFIIAAGLLLFVGASCGNSNTESNEPVESGSDTQASTETGSAASDATNDPKGIGKFKNVELTHPLDEKMVAGGKSVYDVKCQSCHKLTNEKLVGPGWKGVTDRRTPEWIMNFVTNPDPMIEKDTAAQKMLEECLVRMPNQNLSDQDARSVLEFMRNNDGKK